MFNFVILTGRLTADPELQTTQSGVSVTRFSIAVQRSYRKGEEPETDFITVIAWRQRAEFVAKYFKKGNMIGIEGSIQTRKYQDKDGNNRTAFEVIANEVQFVESKKSSDINVTAGEPQQAVVPNPPVGTAASVTVENAVDDDLPF